MSRAFPGKGRGAAGNPPNRYEQTHREAVDDGWDMPEDEDRLPTEIIDDASRSVIVRNRSPDVPFRQSVNPYRGCEHGCVYCYARPSHAQLGFSPGLDFESRIVVKRDAAHLLTRELARPGYRCDTIALGMNTDAWQPVERRLRITRSIVEVLHACRHPLSTVTKSALIERDIDLLADMARHRLVSVAVSVTTLDRGLARRLEPRAASPSRRLAVIRRLADAGIPVTVLAAPLIPVLNDAGLEDILGAAADAGASSAGYVLIRLPGEVGGLFREWLERHAPLRADHVMARIRDCRGGRDNDSGFGTRMRGQGVYADLIADRFHAACRRLRFTDPPRLDTKQFRPPRIETDQLELF